jgi:hypothetical protein
MGGTQAEWEGQIIKLDAVIERELKTGKRQKNDEK